MAKLNFPSQSMILCGGQGIRLREETEFKPKPMIPIGEYPILQHIMQSYSDNQVKSFVLCLGYKGDVIRNYFLNYRLYNTDTTINLKSGRTQVHINYEIPDWEITLAETGQLALTAKRIKNALRHIKEDVFFATYGDGLANINLEKLFEHHKASGCLATVTAVHPSSRFGELDISGTMVKSFREKPQVGEGWINGGYFVFDKKAFDLMDADENITLEDGLLYRLVKENQLSVYRHEGFWQCMDTMREVHLLNDIWEQGNAPWLKST